MSIGLDDGLAPNRRQAFIWTNADPIHWRIYAALGGDELTVHDIWIDASYVNQAIDFWWCLMEPQHQAINWTNDVFHFIPWEQAWIKVFLFENSIKKFNFQEFSKISQGPVSYQYTMHLLMKMMVMAASTIDACLDISDADGHWIWLCG